MGLFDRLFGRGKQKQHIVYIPPHKPNLALSAAEIGELQQYINRLQDVWGKHGDFLGNGKRESRAIGEEINTAYGFAGMKHVCNTIREIVGRSAARELEMAWTGIGDWLG